MESKQQVLLMTFVACQAAAPISWSVGNMTDLQTYLTPSNVCNLLLAGFTFDEKKKTI